MGWNFLWVDTFTFCVGNSSFSFEAWRDEIENVWDRVLSLGFRPFSSEIFSSFTISCPTLDCPGLDCPDLACPALESFSSPLSSPSQIGFQINFYYKNWFLIGKRAWGCITRTAAWATACRAACVNFTRSCTSYWVTHYFFNPISTKKMTNFQPFLTRFPLSLF